MNKYDPVIETENQKRDFALYFNKDSKQSVDQIAKWNNHIVDKTIKGYEIQRELQKKGFIDKLKERVEAATDFIFWQEEGGNAGRNPEDYFGKKKLAELQGRNTLIEIKAKIAEKYLKAQRPTVVNQQHEDIF